MPSSLSRPPAATGAAPADKDVEQDHRVLVVDAPARPVDLHRQLVGDHRPARPAVDDVDVAGLGGEPALAAARSGLDGRPTGVGPCPGALVGTAPRKE